MNGIFTVLIAVGLKPGPDVDDRREQDSRYVGNGWAPPPPPEPFAEHKRRLLLHGYVILHDRHSNPMSRALGEDDLRSMK
jgi:hypothetical protein